MKLQPHQDAFGHGMLDHFNGRPGTTIVERDDGLVEPDGGPAFYFREFKDWRPVERKAVRFVRGRTLDVGCGAGRCMLYLQNKGLDVVGIDYSPLVIQVCRKRGAANVKLLPLTQIGPQLGLFDTILMFGGNFGLVANAKRAKWVFRKFHRLTTGKGRVVFSTRDPYVTNDRVYLDYHKRNRRAGRLSGQVKLRVRYKAYATPWFDWLIVSKKEMADILDGTGWQLTRTFDDPLGNYTGVIEKR